MSRIVVVNGKRDGFVGINKIYIGRQNKSYNLPESPLANPFVLGKDGGRNQVIKLYSEWLWSQIKLDSPAKKELLKICDRLRKHEVLALTCWCHPLPCHGDVIVRCIDWMLSNPDNQYLTQT